MSPEDRDDYLRKIKEAKISLKQYYLDRYLPLVYYMDSNTLSSPPSISNVSTATLSSQHSRSALDNSDMFGSDPIEEDLDMKEPTQELDEFWRTFRRCKGVDPLQWWKMKAADYPHLARLARDILSIPGMFSRAPTFCFYRDLVCAQPQQSRLSVFSLGGTTPSPSIMPASSLKPYVCSCYLNTSFFLGGESSRRKRRGERSLFSGPVRANSD